MSLIKTLSFLLLISLLGIRAYGQADSPNVLIVIAHPDDESGFSGTIYKITHDLKGHADIALITNGEGGYKYSTLAEAIYGVELTDPKVGRDYLPAIRKQELMNAGKILGIRNYFFLDQKDDRYTTDERNPLDTFWDVSLVTTRLNQILLAKHYDFVLTLIPVPGTHGGHKAATILALRAVRNLPAAKRPVILAGTMSSQADTAKFNFTGLKGYPETNLKKDVPPFTFDRTSKFGYLGRLNYKIIANWEIAEHKSQGVMQLGMNMGDYENYYLYDLNDNNGAQKAQALFNALKVIHYKTKTY